MEDINKLADMVSQVAYDIHLYFGTGYLEKVYENALAHRLSKQGIAVQQQSPITVRDEDGFVVGNYEADLVVDERLIVELKAVSQLASAHEAQLLNYLRATGIRHGMLINFG